MELAEAALATIGETTPSMATRAIPINLLHIFLVFTFCLVSLVTPYPFDALARETGSKDSKDWPNAREITALSLDGMFLPRENHCPMGLFVECRAYFDWKGKFGRTGARKYIGTVSRAIVPRVLSCVGRIIPIEHQVCRQATCAVRRWTLEIIQSTS